MTTYTCVLNHYGKEVSIHTFDLPTDNTRSYTIRSIHAFRAREQGKLSVAIERMIATKADKIPHPEWQTVVHSGGDCDPYMYLLRDWPRTHHTTLWELYKAIGYDYKKQRYIN
jgi:hypothetical protein